MAGVECALPENVENVTVDTTRLGDAYEFQQLLGKGGYGEVYKAIDRESGEPVAVKIIAFRNESDVSLIPSAEAECRLLKRVGDSVGVRSPRIRWFGKCEIPKQGDKRDAGICVVMDFIDGMSLYQVVLTCNMPLPDTQYFAMARGLFGNLAALHDAGVVHNDIKLENVMIDRSGDVYLVDFGVSCVKDECVYERIIGTVGYSRPEEEIRRSFESAMEVDVWSAGIVMCELAAGSPLVGEGVSFSLSSIDRVQSPLQREFLREILIEDTSQRPVATMVLEWMDRRDL